MSEPPVTLPSRLAFNRAAHELGSPFNKLEGSFDTEVTSGKPTLTPGSHRPCRPKGQEQSEFNNFTYVGRLLHRISFVSLCRLCK
ncbi:unnamed protein product [Tilletia laevis]|uniref:Uncharacterized protein n=2 Tax=Tilletia TaxID=13289 RepID=A0A9N8MAL1_9BASI|nr:hypothetical protein CF336_g3431 [Tilletia laevis]KAE8261804.1 hypothetical protein A4X03_0g2954 [Tilletia caries]KAE8204678.1 hypothetical protein CF335_g2570 [Tilletia laevis]CAD6893762.1 unnamed protein product [Tilletia caries]CAD6936916.1 unnamed protein product [Tilletia caries]